MNKLHVLLLEDDQIEVIKFTRALTKLEMQHHITVKSDGAEALEYLAETTTLPHIILLDLNMPRIGGIDFLKAIKQDARLKYLPAIVMTTSDHNPDIKSCYEIGVAGYLVKPLKYEDYVSRISAILNYWVVNELIRPQ